MSKKRISNLVMAVIIAAIALSACLPITNGQPTPAQPAEAPTSAPANATANEPANLPAEQQERGRAIVVVTQNETPSVAPGRHSALAGTYKNHLTHNGLFRIAYDTLEPVPDLVASYRAISDTLWEFTIHPGILFHNGEEMTAADVVASFTYLRNYPNAAVQHASFSYAVQTGEFTLTIDTGTPNALLLFDLAGHGNMILPKSLIEAGHSFEASPIGSGPFVFEEWRSGDSLRFTAFDYYFDAPRAAKVDGVTWRILPEGASRTIALETGEADYNVYPAFPDIPRLKANPNIEVINMPGTAYTALLLNNDAPQFNHIAARRAIDMALDTEAIIMAGLDGFGELIRAQMPLSFAGSSNEGVNYFDPEGARALLAEYGIDPSTLDFDILASNEERRRMAEVMQANLADIGITVTISLVDLATMLQTTSDGNYEAAIGGFAHGNLLAYMRGVFHLDSIDGPNRARIRNQELSDLIDQAIATIDTPSRIALLEEASRMANEHVGFSPIFLVPVIRAFNANLSVPENHASGPLNLNMVYWRE